MRLWLLSSFLALVALALWVVPIDAQPGTLKQIVPGVWFREGEIKEMGHCNNVIIEMKDYVIVVDANFPSGARLTLADAKRVSAKPVKYVFLTHHHGDHAYGLAFWTKAGATSIAHQGVVEELKSVEPKRWQQAARQRKDIAELNLPSAELPQQTFGSKPYVLDDGKRRVELRFFGWAHTRGDAVAYLPREKVLCTGDVVVNGAFNFLGDAHIGNWVKVIRAAQKLDTVHVLPGHGGPGGKELMEGQARFFQELYQAVQAAIQQGKKLEEVATTIKLSEATQNWVGSGVANQVRMTWEEITQKKPYGEIARGE